MAKVIIKKCIVYFAFVPTGGAARLLPKVQQMYQERRPPFPIQPIEIMEKHQYTHKFIFSENITFLFENSNRWLVIDFSQDHHFSHLSHMVRKYLSLYLPF